MADISQTTFSNAFFFNENTSNSINISMKFVPEGQINNIPARVQIMAWRRLGYKPLSEQMVVSLLTQICVTRPQLRNVFFRHFRHGINSYSLPVLHRRSNLCASRGAPRCFSPRTRGIRGHRRRYQVLQVSRRGWLSL